MTQTLTRDETHHNLPAPHKEWAPQVWQAMKAWPALPGAAPKGGRGRPAGISFGHFLHRDKHI